MAKTLTVAERVNIRLHIACTYLETFGWARGTHGEWAKPADIRGALLHCVPRDGLELVAYRLIANEGHDLAWNDLECPDLYHAVRALDREFTAANIAQVYGPAWPAIVGLFRMLTTTSIEQRHILSGHIGPADQPLIQQVLETFPGHPAFDDVLFTGSNTDGPMCDPVRDMAYALVGVCLHTPTASVPADLDDLVRPIAERLGL